MENITSIHSYSGNVPAGTIQRAVEAFNTYKSDKEELLSRIRDNEKLYKDSYNKLSTYLSGTLDCSTSFILSSIENFRADASESYPEPNILEREAEGTGAAEALSKLIPIQLDRVGFKKTYKSASRNKAKYGTAIFGVFYDESEGEIDIRELDIRDVYVDMHLPNIQDSAFLFITAAIENDTLKHRYPEYAELFDGDAEIDCLVNANYTLKHHTTVVDCYYKKADGTVHMMKLCNGVVLAATEDMPHYSEGLYRHGNYPVVFDTMYSDCDSPFGFGMIDVGKSTQISINKLDEAITRNIMINSAPRYLSRRNSAIDRESFCDVSKALVEYEGDGDGIKPIESVWISSDALNYRTHKIDELKELLANRDFQQGGTAGGVTAASAIEVLQQSGEKRSRSIINDTYEAYRKIVKMIIEIVRQFYDTPRSFRTKDENGKKTFMEFSNAMMSKSAQPNGYVPLEFDIEIVAQKENPYTRETLNQTLMNLWGAGIMNPDTSEQALILLKSMQFEGKDKLVSDFTEYIEKAQEQQQPQPQQAVIPQQAPTADMGADGQATVPGISQLPQGGIV